MVFKYYKKSVPMARIREAAGAERLGTNIEGMLKAAEKLGFWAKGLAGSPDQLNRETPVPFIAHLRLEDRFHYVVVYKVGRKKIFVADPASGRVRYSREAFTDLWSGIFIALIPSVTFRKGNEGSDSPLWRFMPVLRPHVGVLVEVFFASLLLLFLSLATFFYFRFLVDQVVPGGLTRALHAVSIAMLGIAVFPVPNMAMRITARQLHN
jgi:ATP-binding cassette subfamily B protein